MAPRNCCGIVRGDVITNLIMPVSRPPPPTDRPTDRYYRPLECPVVVSRLMIRPAVF